MVFHRHIGGIMIVNYKGFGINIAREKCMAGYSLLYYSVYTPDKEEIICSFEDSAEKVKTMIKHMKMRVDEYISNPESES